LRFFECSPGKTFARPYLEKPFIKVGVVEWLKVKPEFKPQYSKKKEEKGEGG
jgi:hypothetical protein